jgi:hypothetical protein
MGGRAFIIIIISLSLSLSLPAQGIRGQRRARGQQAIAKNTMASAQVASEIVCVFF